MNLASLMGSGLLAASVLLGWQWPEFRGPDGRGMAAGSGLPLRWSETGGVRWKTAVHGRAWSSPVVLDGQVWLTSATEDGRQLYAMAFDGETGRVVHDLKLFDVSTPQYAHPFNTYASPTPVIEPGRVYVTFGSAGTAALDTATGKVIWQRRDLECNHYRGAGSSPILFRDLLLLHYDGSDLQYVVALDKRTGKTIWTTPRSIDFKDLGPDGKPEAEGDMRKAFSTPQIVTVDGAPLMISMGAKATYAYDPMTGKERWRVEERTNHSASTRPVAGFGLVFLPTGFPKGELLAVRPDGHGDVTATHVAWRLTRGVPNKPSVLLVGDLLFMTTDAGVASAVDARTGAVVWTGRIGGTHSASPVAADGRVYFFDEEGKTTVIDAGRTFKVLAENQLGDGFMASPAIAGKAFYLRSRTHLYRVE
jgi:outer membrane protein assembly factor BamB